MDRNVNVITDLAGKKLVIINDILFKGRQNIKWNEVESYIKQYVGDFIDIEETGDVIYIGSDLPDEYARSKHTAKLKGAMAKAKANAAQGIPKLVEIATNRRFKENLEKKHQHDAKLGWYRYDSRFALPVYSERGELERYNVYRVELVIRHSADGKLYLYDIINAKKETGTPLEP